MTRNFFLLFLLVLFCTACSRADILHAKAKPADEYSQLVSHFDYTIPTPKHIQLTDKVCSLGKKAQLETPEDFSQQYPAIIASVTQTLAYFGQANGHEPSISFNAGIKGTAINKLFNDALNKNGAYTVTINCPEITISANSGEGFINGITTLESMIATHKGKLPIGTITDHPSTKVRALHLSLWPTTLTNLKVAIKRARFSHYNALIVLNHRGVKLESLSHLSLKNALSLDDFRHAVGFTKENGLELIPELKLLSHQDKFFGTQYPQYLFNKLTYDPRQPAVYSEVVFPAIEELLSLTGATKFHIGHDEVAGWTDWFVKTEKLNKGEKQLPPELFLQDILTLHRFLTEKHIEVWMWGDMLVTKDEFPVMINAGANLNGLNGYDKLRSKIPRDIIINAWHYRGNQTEFPTASAFAQLGHTVLGATWKDMTTTRNFTRYLKNMPANNAGMIATTWYGISEKNQDVHNIITESGEIFWNGH